MKIEDQFQYLVGGYYGVASMDEYELKVYVLKEIEDYIRQFILENPIPNFDYFYEAQLIEERLSLRTKLQDALLVLHRINASMDLILMIKAKLKKMESS